MARADDGYTFLRFRTRPRFMERPYKPTTAEYDENIDTAALHGRIQGGGGGATWPLPKALKP